MCIRDSSNAAVFRSPNEGHVAFGGFYIRSYVDSLDRRVRRLDILNSEEGCERVRSDEEVLRMERRG